MKTVVVQRERSSGMIGIEAGLELGDCHRN